MTRSAWLNWFVSAWAKISCKTSKLVQRGETTSKPNAKSWPAASSDGPPDQDHGKGERLFLRYRKLQDCPSTTRVYGPQGSNGGTLYVDRQLMTTAQDGVICQGSAVSRRARPL